MYALVKEGLDLGVKVGMVARLGAVFELGKLVHRVAQRKLLAGQVLRSGLR